VLVGGDGEYNVRPCLESTNYESILIIVCTVLNSRQREIERMPVDEAAPAGIEMIDKPNDSNIQTTSPLRRYQFQ